MSKPQLGNDLPDRNNIKLKWLEMIKKEQKSFSEP
jgi:hypothetical protein